ncbi:hypothetical protein [Micromonospora sp. RTGN7]|uniref:hypothetical protein n=1 Tax=Micromonospora sp. RTGN7 TaxID=3016526 RepID=UPI0029FEFFA6|nr:hypothetical protein [Micromonospora sp. RTGN7]
MTLTATPLDGVRTPCWSARAYAEADRDQVLAMFTEPDFYFRTAQPDTRPEWEILDLLGTDTEVLLADGEPVGLFVIEAQGAEHGGHCHVHLRLRSDAPLSWWCQAYDEAVRALRWRREVVRISLLIGEYDQAGLRMARAVGLTEEGTLAEVVVHEGRRYGYVFFSQIWVPTS